MFLSKLRIAVFLFVVSIIIFFSVAFFNQNQVYPNKSEINAIKKVFPSSIRIKTFSDVIKIQNLVIDSIRHYVCTDSPVNIVIDLRFRRGLCYNRSLLLQKIMLMNGFKVRPLYLFFSKKRKTVWFDFFLPSVDSHSLFEMKYGENWYLIRTNTKMMNAENIYDYFRDKNCIVPRHALFLRYLSNRNGRFIYPSFLPDFYGFFCY
jgi:hypothetical protein